MMFTGPGRSANCWSKPAKRHHLFKIPDWLKKTNVLLKPPATWSQCRHHTPLSMENGESKSERLSIATLDTSRCWFPGLWNSSRFNYFTWSPTKLDWNLTLIKSLKHRTVPQLSHPYHHVTYFTVIIIRYVCTFDSFKKLLAASTSKTNSKSTSLQHQRMHQHLIKYVSESARVKSFKLKQSLQWVSCWHDMVRPGSNSKD